MNQLFTIIKCSIIISAFIFSGKISATIVNVPGDHSTIQAGITAASTGDTVLVQSGTYYEHINFNGKAITVGSLFITTGNKSYIASTIIDGSGSNSCVKFNSGETSTSVLSGFTITDGGAYYGAGIYCYSGSSPTLSHLDITDNNGDSGDSYGGGLCCMDNSSPACSNLTFSGNEAEAGGAVYCHLNSDATFSDCIFTDNTSSHGGAMQISYSSPTISYSLFYENDSPFGGAVYVYNYSTPEFINCTFAENTSTYGGAFYLTSLQGQPTITNCILWDNVCSYNLEIFVNSSVYPPIVTYSDVEGATGETWFGTGCLDTNPLFTDAANDDYTLTEFSPCIDAGDPSSPLDEDGTVADQGCYPYIIAFASDYYADNTSICQGDAVLFTDASIGSPTSWDWTFEGGTPPTSTDQNPTVTYNTVGVFNVTLTISDGSNNSTLIKENYINVSVLPVQANTPAGPTDVCSRTQHNYTTESVAGANYYEWEVDPTDAGTITGTDTVGSFTADESWSGDYTIRVRAGNQCGDAQWSAVLNCTLNAMPSIFDLSDGGAYCDGDNGIEITQDGSETGVDYELFFEGETTGTIIAGTGNEISYGFFTEEGDYTAEGFTATCSDYMGGTAIITVDYVPEPAGIPIGDESVCVGSTTDYTVMPIEDADTIYWSLTPAEAGTIMGSRGDISIEWASDFEGLAQLTAQGHNQCGFGIESDELEISCSTIPAPEILGLSMVCKEESADYETLYNDGSTYEWTVSGGEIIIGEGTNEITVLWGVPGIGTVDLTETMGEVCVGTAEIFEVTIDDCTGIGEASFNNLNVYPNPATNHINIQSDDLIKSIRVFDFTGKEVASENVHTKLFQLNTSRFNSGIYILVIRIEKSISTKRIVIE